MKIHDPIITKKGVELPITDMKGKPYLQVAYRLVWFREDHPDWTIDTTLVERNDQFALVEARILNDQGRVISCDRKMVTKASFQAYVEKATTGAIGRALALCGYGTQFDPEEFSDDDRPEVAADSPVARPKQIPQPQAQEPKPQNGPWKFSIKDKAIIDSLGGWDRGNEVSKSLFNKLIIKLTEDEFKKVVETLEREVK